MPEKALLGTFEGGSGRGLCLTVQRAGLARDVGGPHRGVEVVVDDAEPAGIGIIDADLLGRKLVLYQFVLDAFVRERTGGIETEGLEVAREHLHRRDTALLDRLDELCARGEGEIFAAPQPAALGVSEVMNGGGAGRRDVDDARVRQGMLQTKSGTALLRRSLVATFALPAGRVLHRVALVEDNDTVETAAHPLHALLDPRNLLVPGMRSQRGVGGGKEALLETDRRPLP